MKSYFETIKLPLYTADFQYFRIPREKWELMLARLGQMGLDAVSIALPWAFHELEPASFDLQGTTNARRNVVGLIELCANLNIACLLQLGPYHHNRGLLRDGLPGWLPPVEENVEANLRVPAKSWFLFLSRNLSQYQWPAGPVAALHIDSQAGPVAQPTYSRELTEVKWPIWLRKQYRGIGALNEAYGASYRSVSKVPFPQSWGLETEQLEEDARRFLADVDDDSLSGYDNVLAEAGWQIPIYDFDTAASPELSGADWSGWADRPAFVPLGENETIRTLPSPIQVEPDPIDVGNGPGWARGAPIRADGSLTPKFWDLRRQMWSQIYPDSGQEGHIITRSFAGGGLVTAAYTTPLKLALKSGTKPAAYRLDLRGKLAIEEKLKAFRGKLRGDYFSQDNVSQTDLIIYLDDSAVPVPESVRVYLAKLLHSQAQTLQRCSLTAGLLAQSLSLEAPSGSAAESRPKPTSYTLSDARRGLKEADAALRKVIRSVGNLEMGFDAMLGRDKPPAVKAAATPTAIGPEIFEGRAREILLDAGDVCRQIGPRLDTAAKALQHRIDDPAGFTGEQYQQSYQAAVDAAQDGRHQLLPIIAQLRTEIAAERLPLVSWRVHDQIQALAESLRWGVMRG